MNPRGLPRSIDRSISPASVRFAGASITLVLLVLTSFGPASAQQAAVTGRVVDAGIGEPVPSALIELETADGRVARSTTTAADGRFRLDGVTPGTYSVAISTLGYRSRTLDDVELAPGARLDLGTLGLESRAVQLNPVVVTASRDREKALEAPASIHTVPAERIEEQPATTPVEHVRELPGVDIVTTGLAQHNVVSRGFNNVFSGSLFVLTDNRWASVPSLRFNAYNLIPQTNEDIERIEFVLGPGSALYGPNVSNGVMHIITRSPLQTHESVVSVTGGERDVFKGTVRHAGLITENVGYKLSGMYFRGRDWTFTDPVEEQDRQTAIALGADPDTLLIGRRDFDQERFSGTARFDLRFTDRSTLVLEGGATRMGSSIEMTGIGAAQADDWTYSYLQARLNHDGLFAQAYLNLSDAGNTYTLRDGQPIIDNSLLYVAQVQHASNVSDRQRFIYGADFIRTVPRTDSTITGKNEQEDNVTEVGAYVQSETALTPRLDAVLAVRTDYHDVVENVVFSPRAALVFKPVEGHNLRLTYNRAFSQPNTNNMFLDLRASPTLGPFDDFAVRASGAVSGFTFRRDCGPMSDELCMRSPFNPDPDAFIPIEATRFWQDAVTGLDKLARAGELEALGDQLDPGLEALLRSLDPTAQVGTTLRRLNPTTGSFEGPVRGATDVEPIKSTTQNTLEVGYKGIVSDRLLLSFDVYYNRIQDFVGPLLVETPSAFLDAASLGAFLGDTLAAEGYTLTERLTIIGGLSNVPLGTVTPEQPPDPDRPADVFLTYRNFGEVDIWGADLSATLLLTDELSFTGAYSFVSDDFFEDLGGVADVALNAPQNKAALTARYRNERAGLSVELRGRYVDAFPVNSGVYVGHVDAYTVFDANLTYALPFRLRTELTLNAQNIFDDRHQEMVGAPRLGRLVMVRLRQTF